MKRHLVIDRNTGEARIQARGGATYSMEEVEAIERRAKAGDAAATAIIESLDVTGVTPAQMMHDCPECRAAMAFGEEPMIFGPDEIDAMTPRAAARPLGALPRTGRPVMRRRPYRPRHR
jgi:hypothetical protein